MFYFSYIINNPNASSLYPIFLHYPPASFSRLIYLPLLSSETHVSSCIIFFHIHLPNHLHNQPASLSSIIVQPNYSSLSFSILSCFIDLLHHLARFVCLILQPQLSLLSSSIIFLLIHLPHPPLTTSCVIVMHISPALFSCISFTYICNIPLTDFSSFFPLCFIVTNRHASSCRHIVFKYLSCLFLRILLLHRGGKS